MGKRVPGGAQGIVGPEVTSWCFYSAKTEFQEVNWEKGIPLLGMPGQA
jgi:hypothetical protein